VDSRTILGAMGADKLLGRGDLLWEDALHIASAPIQMAPKSPLGWVHRSYCLREMKRTDEARDDYAAGGQ
jgi:hypothetical protein